eukprot:GHRR01006596.1.p1 GENE.GHRR01006596.1~~GHRR01006596.1.p1  ORF type:complete len:549 (+),score=146.27 GHRR01006596.1:232-1878(+)
MPRSTPATLILPLFSIAACLATVLGCGWAIDKGGNALWSKAHAPHHVLVPAIDVLAVCLFGVLPGCVIPEGAGALQLPKVGSPCMASFTALNMLCEQLLCVQEAFMQAVLLMACHWCQRVPAVQHSPHSVGVSWWRNTKGHAGGLRQYAVAAVAGPKALMPHGSCKQQCHQQLPPQMAAAQNRPSSHLQPSRWRTLLLLQNGPQLRCCSTVRAYRDDSTSQSLQQQPTRQQQQHHRQQEQQHASDDEWWQNASPLGLIKASDLLPPNNSTSTNSGSSTTSIISSGRRSRTSSTKCTSADQESAAGERNKVQVSGPSKNPQQCRRHSRTHSSSNGRTSRSDKSRISASSQPASLQHHTDTATRHAVEGPGSNGMAAAAVAGGRIVARQHAASLQDDLAAAAGDTRTGDDDSDSTVISSDENGGSSDEVNAAVARISRFLDFRERCASEVENKLLSLGYSKQLAGQALGALQRSGLQSDARFAEMFVRGQWNRKADSPTRLAYELKARGVAQKHIEPALAAVFGANGQLPTHDARNNEEQGGQGGCRVFK